jgi:dihydrofolate synthase/folylpolyglutamate synthase
VSYPDSVRYLYSLGNELKAGAKFGIERMQKLLGALGNPERPQRFIHVAGTNGKGSTCAMIASALQFAGLQTGLYTSPHLATPTERIQIDGRPISESRFVEIFEIVHRRAEAMLDAGELDAHPSYFETVTAMAFLAFQDQTDVVVLEVGLGGRLDATNVVSPLLCVITPVDYDHEVFLGKTLISIASEKAGILKPGVPVVVGRQHPAAEQVILARAAELGCKIISAEDHKIGDIALSPYGSKFTFNGNRFDCPLPGRHQTDNALNAILACQELSIPMSAIAAGLARTRWPGRLEFVSRHPDFVLDGAHNPSGAGALASYIREFHKDHPVWIVYGAMRDKAIDEVTGQLFPLASKLIVTAPNFPRALRPEAILQMTGHPNAIAAATIEEAIELARQAPGDAAVFFTGSLFVVGEARALLKPAESNAVPHTIVP